jgi:hypothetical protein
MIAWGDSSLFSNLVTQMDIAALGEDFENDRLALVGRKTFGSPELREAASQQMLSSLRSHCQILEAQLLKTGAYVMGSAISVVDAAMWAHVWFLKVLSQQPNRPLLKGLLREMPAVKEWAARISAITNSAESQRLRTPITAEEATQIATDAEPLVSTPVVSELDVKNGLRELEMKDGLVLGQTVTVKATDSAYTIEGVLHTALPHQLILLREHQQAGLTAIHLPRAGFIVRPAGGQTPRPRM